MNNSVLAVILLAASIWASPTGDSVDNAVVESSGDMPAEEVIKAVDVAEVVEEEVVEVAEVPADNDDEMVEDPIKEENKGKCGKCHAPIFRHKHEKFCVKCTDQGLVSSSQHHHIATVLKCKKCRKTKFRARHGEFCERQCEDPTTVAVILPQDEADQPVEVPKKKDKTKKKNKDKAQEVENVVEDSYETEFASTIIDNSVQEDEQTDLERLGPFGAILKHLIVQNTWGSAN